MPGRNASPGRLDLFISGFFLHNRAIIICRLPKVFTRYWNLSIISVKLEAPGTLDIYLLIWYWMQKCRIFCFHPYMRLQISLFVIFMDRFITNWNTNKCLMCMHVFVQGRRKELHDLMTKIPPRAKKYRFIWLL